MRKKYTIVVYYPSFATLGPVVDRKDPEIAGPARGRAASQKKREHQGRGIIFKPKKKQYIFINYQ